jgi:GntR family transcriptional regulator, transcriptional repressor for pyruvate dehydrogenase complex
VLRFYAEGKDKSAQVASLYELKVLIEGDAAALAAMCCTEQDIVSLKGCLETLTMAMRDGLDGGNANFDFHQTIIDAAGNQYLISLMNYVNERLWDLLAEDENQPSNLTLTQSSYEEHVRLFEAIAAGDPEQARRALYSHLENAAHRRGIAIFKDRQRDGEKA